MTIGKRQDIAFFLSFCIEQYKTRKGMTGTQAMTELRSYGVLDYLCDNYEALHTQGSQWLVEEMEEYIRIRKTDSV